MRSGWLFFGRTFCLRTRFSYRSFAFGSRVRTFFLRMSRYFWISRRSGPLFRRFPEIPDVFSFSLAGQDVRQKSFRLRRRALFCVAFLQTYRLQLFFQPMLLLQAFFFSRCLSKFHCFLQSRQRLRIHCRLLHRLHFRLFFLFLISRSFFTNRALHDLSLLFGFLICIYSLIK